MFTGNVYLDVANIPRAPVFKAVVPSQKRERKKGVRTMYSPFYKARQLATRLVVQHKDFSGYFKWGQLISHGYNMLRGASNLNA